MDRKNKTKAAPGQGNAAFENASQQNDTGAEKARKDKDAKAIKSRSTGTDAQFARIVALLREKPQTTYELRGHGIGQTSTRIFDLRARGYVINTELCDAYDRDGYLHFRVAKYALIQEPLPIQSREAANDSD